MAPLRKLFICPFFGPLPSWMDEYRKQFSRMSELYGFDWFITQDLDDFNARCEKYLGFTSNITPGTGKLHDYRCALGVLYPDIIEEYAWWGTTDFDCVYGDVDVDRFLPNCDVLSDEEDYVGGHFTLYRNTREVNNAFRANPRWKEHMLGPHSGWVEKEYTQTLKESGLRLDFHKLPNQIVHFNHSKVWPIPTTL